VSVGVLTAVVGAVMCMSQQHLKRMLALSTVSHSGVMLIGVGLLGAKGLAGAAIYVIGHGLVKASLFACTGVLVHRTGKADREHLHGRCRGMPWTATLWMIGGLGLAGMPPFAMYIGNGLIDEASHHEGAGWLLLVGALASVLTGAAVIRAGANVFLGWGPRESDPTSARHGAEQRPDTTEGHDRTPATMFVPALALLVAAAVAGLVWHLVDATEGAAERFIDRPTNAAAVLDGAVGPHVQHAVTGGPPASMLVTGLLTTVAALIVAVVGIWRERLPQSMRELAARAFMPPIRAVRAAHSGHVGDYVAWITLATAALGGALLTVVNR
jgi:multicomponent Na+:H+ antiporter subunit D